MAAPLCGRRVIVSGITGRAELNGRTGTAESFNDENGRYVVQLDPRPELGEVATGPKVALRAHNVLPEPENQGRAGGGGAAGNGAGWFGGGAQNGAGWFGGGQPEQPQHHNLNGWDPQVAAGTARIAGVATILVLTAVLGFTLLVSVVVGAVVWAIVSGHPVATQQATAYSQWLNRMAGLQLAPAQAALGTLATVILLLYVAINGGPSMRSSSYGSRYGGGGGVDFFWIMGAMMLASMVYRMGGGGQPGGWNAGQLWHSLSNMNIWEGMMLLNLLQRVMGGGGRGYGGGFGRRRMY
eukprot:m.12299 g.12299  ORF g.12299 m.12299 type:complete len:296 (+) comp4530_c0_seq1:68-955(+)